VRKRRAVRKKPPTSGVMGWVRHGHGGIDWVKVIGLAMSGAGLTITVIKAVLTLGIMAADVKNVKEEQKRQGDRLEKVYEHVAFGKRGELGPAPPVE